MTDFVLPTQDTFDAVDNTGYTISDSDAGFLTREVGAVIKMLVDQMPNTELVHVRSPRTATGKTEKFIVDNVASADAMPKIVTSDFFGNTIVDCTNFFTYTGNHAKIFKNIFKAPVLVEDDDGNPTSITVGSTAGTDVTYDLSVAPPARSSSDIAGITGFDDAFNMTKMKNSVDTQLGTADDDFRPNLVFASVCPVSTVKTDWDQHSAVTVFSTAFNSLPNNGVMIADHVEISWINTALWSVLNAQTSAGKTYNISWIASEGDGEVVDVAVIKRLS